MSIESLPVTASFLNRNIRLWVRHARQCNHAMLKAAPRSPEWFDHWEEKRHAMQRVRDFQLTKQLLAIDLEGVEK